MSSLSAYSPPGIPFGQSFGFVRISPKFHRPLILLFSLSRRTLRLSARSPGVGEAGSASSEESLGGRAFGGQKERGAGPGKDQPRTPPCARPRYLPFGLRASLPYAKLRPNTFDPARNASMDSPPCNSFKTKDRGRTSPELYFDPFDPRESVSRRTLVFQRYKPTRQCEQGRIPPN